MDMLNQSDYAENLNTMFRVAEPGEPSEIQLTTVNELKINGEQESFSLIFHGGKDRFLPQGLYDLEHDSLGNSGIFLVPVGEQENGYLYEAVFNRMKREERSFGE